MRILLNKIAKLVQEENLFSNTEMLNPKIVGEGKNRLCYKTHLYDEQMKWDIETRLTYCYVTLCTWSFSPRENDITKVPVSD